MTWQTPAGAQGWFGWMNYGVNGTGGVDGSGDMADVFTRIDLENRVNGTASDQAEGGANSRRFYYDHMRARIVLTNAGTTPIFWEVYECVARKDVPITPEGGTLQQFYNNVSNAAYQGSLLAGASQPGGPNSVQKTSAVSRPSQFTTGCTPFQFRHFCQNFKVLKVTRLQASAGNTVSFDASQPRNVVMNWDDYQNLLAKRGLTKIYLVRQWGAVVAGTPPHRVSILGGVRGREGLQLQVVRHSCSSTQLLYPYKQCRNLE